MKFLKLTNVPIKLIKSGKYGGDGEKLPWELCGFNTALLSLKSIQYEEGENHYSYLPVSDEALLNTKLDLLNDDIVLLGNESSAEIVEAEFADLEALRIASLPVE